MQFDSTRKPWWVLQDAGGDVAALCDNGSSVTGTPFVAAQWTYDAYGAVLSADHLAPHPFLHFGHKGLFFDRLDVGIADAAVPGANPQETPRLVPFAKSVYYARNRSYLPDLGRWMQADPFGSGFPIVGSSWGRGRMAVPAVFDFVGIGPGSIPGSRYSYLNCRTWLQHDPLGLVSELDAVEGQRILPLFLKVQYEIQAFALQHYAKAVVAAEIAAGLGGAPGEPSPFQGNSNFIGKVAESSLEFLGGEANVVIRTSTGIRIFDRVIRESGTVATKIGSEAATEVEQVIGLEVKAGRVPLSTPIRNQIDKTVEIIKNNTDEMTNSIWVFLFSPASNKGGPSKKLAAALNNAGIKWFIVGGGG